MLPYAAKRLVWLAGNDYENLASRCSERPDITILRVDWRIDRLFAACDLVITKANRTTVFEAASLGIPSISLSTGANWPDEVAISGIRSNVMLNARFITPENLAKHISEGVRSGRRPTNSLPQWSGIEAAAERISRAIEDIRAALIRVRNASPEEAEVIPYVDAVGRSH
jgi:UDP-N-acetylglucosamine:LPS N-acetylglucosamine transferase